MNYRRHAQKEAYLAVPETCPVVDEALSKAIAAASDAIKDQTGALREALVDALERAIAAEDLIEDLKRSIGSLERGLEEARAAIE